MAETITLDGKEYARVCRLDELRAGRSRLLYFDEERQVAVFNAGGEILGVTNICPHQHAPVIAEGFVEDCTVTCPLHGWTYDLKSGRAIGGGARLKTFDVRIIDDVIYVEIPADEEPTWFKGL